MDDNAPLSNGIPPENNSIHFIDQVKTKPQKRIFILVIALAIITILLLGFAVFGNSKDKPEVIDTLPSMWELKFVKNTKTNKLSLKSVNIRKGVAQASPQTSSPYKLYVYDRNKIELFKTDIFITELYMNNIYMPPGEEGTPGGEIVQPENIESVVTIPYFNNASTIVVTQYQVEILNITPPKLSWQINVSKSYAAGPSCTPLTIAFIGDGYSDMSLFRKQVDVAKNIILSTDPYSTKTGIFDFKIIENPITNNLGCYVSGKYRSACVTDPATKDKARNAVYSAYPNLSTNSDYTKIAILVNSGLDGKIMGNIDMPAGAMSTFQTQFELANTFLHEFGGHGIGKLLDRYVGYGASNFPPGFSKSNCTQSSQGESFWSTAGADGRGFPACLASNFYAPEANNCGKAGNSHTVMSAGGGCAVPQFDKVEKYWINTQIIPLYSECSDGTVVAPPAATATTAPSSSTPTATPAPVNSIVGVVFSDTNGNSKRDSGESGVAGASLSLEGGGSKTTASGADGRYSFLNLTTGSTYTVTLTHSGQSVTSDSIPLPANLSRAPEVNFGIQPAASGGTDPVITATTPTPVVIPTLPPTGKPSSGGFQLNGTPTPTPEQYYTCNPDPKCIESRKSIQLCPLICLPQG